MMVTGTNWLLRGLSLGTNYFVAVSAVDTTGNESPLSRADASDHRASAPDAADGVAARFGADGTNILMWALSEDDGYNDRDVVRYDVFSGGVAGRQLREGGRSAGGDWPLQRNESCRWRHAVRGLCGVGGGQQWLELFTGSRQPVSWRTG